MSEDPFKILLMNSRKSKAGIRRIRRMLDEAATGWEVIHASDLEEGLAALSGSSFDAVLLDFSLPAEKAQETFFRMKEAAGQIPVIILAGSREKGWGVEAIREGAADYLVKDILSGALLVRAVRHARERKQYQSLLEKASLEWRSTVDAITDPLLLVDSSHEIVKCNRAMADFLGKSFAEVVGRKCYELIHGLDSPPKFCPQFLLSPKDAPHHFELNLPERNRDFIISTFPRVESDGRMKGVVHVMHDITRRKALEKDLQRSEELFRIAAETATDLIYELDLKTGEFRWFGKIDEVMGYPPAEFPRKLKHVLKQIHPDDRPRTLKAIEAHLKEGRPFEEEYRVQKKDGGYVTIYSRARALRDANGKVVRWIGCNTDITERRRMQDALRISEENYRLLVETQQDAILKISWDGRCLFASPSFCRLFGVTEADVVGKNIWPDLFPDSLELAAEIRPRLESPPYAAYREHLVNTAAGEKWIAWSLTSIVNEQDKPEAVICVGRDITPRKQYENTIQKLNQLLETVVALLPSALALLDQELRVEMTNRQFDEITRRPPAEVQGRRMEEFVSEDFLEEENFLDSLRQVAVEGGEKNFFGVKHTSPEHEDKFLDILVRGFSLPGGDRRVLVVINDVTKQTRLREELFQMQKTTDLHCFAGGVLHEINNFLTPMLVYIDTLKKDLGPEHPNYRDAEEIALSALRLKTFSRQLTIYSRKEVSRKEITNLNESVETMSNMLSRLVGEKIKLEHSMEKELWNVKLDPAQFEQILFNLVSNARDAMLPQGGRIVITSRNLELDENQAQAYPKAAPGRYVMVSVADTGSGMDMQTQRRIFEPFFTTKSSGKGSGMGMSVVLELIKLNGGHIFLESAPGRGTTIKTLWPVCEEPVEVKKKMPEEEKAVTERWTGTALVVEDNDEVRQTIDSILTQLGFSILKASDGASALQVCRNHPGSISLLVTDLGLPDMTGKELTQILLLEQPRMKIILTSGYLDRLQNEEEREGIFGVLAKPFGYIQLAEKVHWLMKQKT